MGSPIKELNEDICLNKNYLKRNHQSIYKMNRMNQCEQCGKNTILSVCVGCMRKNATLKDETQISSITKPNMKTFWKFPVGVDKIPIKGMWWGDKGDGGKHLWRRNLKGNNGIPCGEVNGITIVDLDFYKLKEDGSEIAFIKEFGEDYLKRFDTLTQETTSGGEHLIFQYDPDFRNVNNHEHQIDLKNNGGYVVGAGSKCHMKQDKDKPVSQKRIGEYKIINNQEIKPIPHDLKEWLIKNQQDTTKKVKEQKARTKKQVELQGSIGYYCYNITDKKVKQIITKIPDEYWTTHDKWLLLATAMKAMNKCELFLKMCAEHPKTNYTNPNHPPNVQQLNTIKKQYDIPAVEHIFNQAIKSKTDEKTFTYRTDVDYIKYKPTIKSQLKTPTLTGNWDKLGKHISLPNNKKCIVIRSDTGTGKTTIVKDYLADQPNCKFISMVSRISLGEEQYSIFRDEGLSCKLYNEKASRFKPDDSMVICVDSLKKIVDGDFGDYIIFMDEFNSLVEHLFSSATLNDRRTDVFEILCSVLKEAKQIFCVDADIQNHTLKLLDYLDIDYDLYVNTYQHNKDVKATEHFKVDTFIENLVKSDKFLMCCDSKSSAIKIGRDNFDKLPLTNKEKLDYAGMMVFKDEKGLVVVITSDNNIYVQLDSFDRVIISPKIIYGVDSQTKRDVYCWYEEHTINPRMMVQQICRTRNINSIQFIFFKKSFKTEKFISVEETHDYIKKFDGYAIWKRLYKKEDNDIWMKIMSVILYNDDCYGTNKFAHFRNLLQTRGVLLEDWKVAQTEKSPLSKMKQEYKQEQIENFDKFHPKIIQINEHLRIPMSRMEEFKELLLFDNKRNQNQMAIKWMIKGGIKLDTNLAHKEDYCYNKMKSKNNTLVILEKFMKDVGIERKDDMIAKKGLDETEAKLRWTLLNDVFRFRLTSVVFGPQTQIDDLKEKKLDKIERVLDFNRIDECSLVIEKMMTQIFGASFKIPYEQTEAQIASGNTKMNYTKLNLFNTQRKTKHGIKYTINQINPDYFVYHNIIGNFRNTDCRTDNIEWEFGKEDMNYDKGIEMEKSDGKWSVKFTEEEVESWDDAIFHLHTFM